jgi:protease-4
LASSRNVILGVIIGVFLLLFLVFFIIGIVGMISSERETTWAGFGDKVAVVEIRGEIIESQETVRQLRDFADNGSVKGILVRINSPGGVVSPAQEIYNEIKRIRSETGKPVVISMGSLAASGAYYISCGGDYIFANPGTLTGSIGVILQYPVVKELFNKLGIQYETIKSGPVKDAGSPFREPSKQDSLMLQAAINDIYEQFVDVVATARGLDHEQVRKLADGSVYTGHQALELGLIDTLGGMQDALRYLAEESGITGEIRVIRPKPKRERSIFDLLGSIKEKYIDADLGGGPQLMYLYK